MVEGKAGDRPVVLGPSYQDRCAECGGPVRDAWVSYRHDPDDAQTLIKHFGGIVRTGPEEPQRDMPRRSVREFRYPEDLGAFFHPTCAPEVKLSEKMQQEIAAILADVIVADTRRHPERWRGGKS